MENNSQDIPTNEAAGRLDEGSPAEDRAHLPWAELAAHADRSSSDPPIGPESEAPPPEQQQNPEFREQEEATRYDQHLYVPLAPMYTATPKPQVFGTTRSALPQARTHGVFGVLAALAAAAAVVAAILVFRSSFQPAASQSSMVQKSPASQPLRATPTAAARIPAASVLPPGSALVLSTPVPAVTVAPLLPLRLAGALGFPQSSARVLVDKPSIRLSAASDPQWLYVQGIFWADTSPDPDSIKEENPRDTSILMIDADASGSDTPYVDRQYLLNPYPFLPGLHYSESRESQKTTPIQNDSQGFGAIRWVKDVDGRMVRIDSYVIPLAELKRRPGDHVRFGVYFNSDKPGVIISAPPSTNSHTGSPAIYDLQYPHFMDYTLDGKSAIQLAAVPNDSAVLSARTIMPRYPRMFTGGSKFKFRNVLASDILETFYSSEMPAPALRPAEVPDQPGPEIVADSEETVRSAGAFGFPQSSAKVIIDSKGTSGTRVSVASDAHYLYVQAVHFRESTATLSQQPSQMDRASLSLIRPGATSVPDVQFWLNEYYDARGLVMTVPRPRAQGGGARRLDSEGRASIRWARNGSSSLIRIDSFLIPLSEIGCAPGDSIQFAAYRYSYMNPAPPNGNNSGQKSFLERYSSVKTSGIRFRREDIYRIDAAATIVADLVPNDYPHQTADSVAETDPRRTNLNLRSELAAEHADLNQLSR